MLQRIFSVSSISSFRGDQTTTATTGPPRRMTKCAVTHRVERLIHLELEDRFGRDGRQCQCGTVHKEWFHGGKGDENGWVDVRDVISRWVGFARVAYGEVIA